MILRLLTINTHKGFSWFNRRFVLTQLREAIRSTSADIVFLQEVIGEHAEKAKKHADWPSDSHYEFLADSVWRDFAYGKNAVYPEGHHGNAILSRYPIAGYQKIDISTNRFEQRGFLHCEVKVPGLRSHLHCVCVHLGLLGRSRTKQYRMLASYIHSHIPENMPLVVGGDFNDWRGKSSKEFAEPLGFKEVYAEIKGRHARTFPARLPVLQLDRFYVRHLDITHSEAFYQGPWAKLSDHAALLSEVTLSRPRAPRTRS